jgi:oligosaccharide repeat unit polymerase
MLISELIRDSVGSPWPPVLLLAAGTVYMRIRSRCWFAPSAFLGLLWSVYLGATLFLLPFPETSVGIWILVSLVISTELAAALGEVNTEVLSIVGDRKRLLGEEMQRRLLRTCSALILVALLGSVYFIWSSFQRFKLSPSFDSFLRLGGLWTLLRYQGVVDPWPLRIAAIWPYPSALLGGVLFGLTSHRYRQFVAMASLVPAALMTVLLGGRAAILLGLAFWLSGYWTADRALTKASRKLFSGKMMIFALSVGGGLLFVFFLVFGLRGAANTGKVVIEVNSGQTRDYMFGSPIAFAQWCDDTPNAPLTWGGLTFPGLYDLLGIRRRTIGTYRDYVNTTGLEETNIFTMFRGLIEDFTLPGAFLICALGGYLSGCIYSRPLLRCRFILGLSAFYSTALFSPLYFIFGFNSSIFAWVVAWFVLRPKARISAPRRELRTMYRAGVA